MTGLIFMKLGRAPTTQMIFKASAVSLGSLPDPGEYMGRGRSSAVQRFELSDYDPAGAGSLSSGKLALVPCNWTLWSGVGAAEEQLKQQAASRGRNVVLTSAERFAAMQAAVLVHD